MIASYPGRVFLDGNFQFVGGTRKRKYFVILTDCPIQADHVLIALTTSKSKSEPAKGCYNNVQFPSFYIPSSENPIGSESWLMLSEVFPVPIDGLRGKELIGDLAYEVTKEIMACAAGSERIERIYKNAIRDHSKLLK